MANASLAHPYKVRSALGFDFPLPEDLAMRIENAEPKLYPAFCFITRRGEMVAVLSGDEIDGVTTLHMADTNDELLASRLRKLLDLMAQADDARLSGRGMKAQAKVVRIHNQVQSLAA